MKKALLTNPAFRYIFEIFIIVFSVTVSFYIQNVLNEKDKMELKNESLKGVLIDLNKDKGFYEAALESIFNRLNSSDRLIEKPKGGIVIEFPFTSTAAIQECHIFVLQLICRSIDYFLLGEDI